MKDELDVANLKLNTSLQRQVFDENYRIKHKITTAYLTNKLHTHNFYEILFCCSNNVFFLINDVICLLKANDIMIFNDSDVHGLIADKDAIFDRYVIEFDPNYVKNLCDTMDLLEYFHQPKKGAKHIVSLSSEQANVFLSLFDRLNSYENDHSYGIELNKKLTLSEILLQVNTFLRNDQTQPIEKSRPEYEKIQNVLSYINNNLTEDLSLKAISNMFFISNSSLGTIFKAVTGFTVNNYIINQRIILATKLLKENMPVAQVAEACGFNNYAHFIRTFKKFEGLPPKQYTLQYLKGSPKTIA